MKKILGLILAICLVFAVAANAFAAKKLTITQQPATATTTKQGTVSFSVKVSGTVQSISWYFINPETGESYTGKKLSSAVKGVRVSNPNSKKITLKKVPESMHGWVVYCHINGNGYKLDSDMVMLLVNGLEPPKEMPSIMLNRNTGTDSESGTPAATAEPVKTSIVVSCNAKALKKMDKSGNVEEGDPVNKIDFGEDPAGYVYVTSEEPILSYTVNGVQVQPVEPVTEFKLMNVKSNVTLRLKINRASASANVDMSHMCRVVCKGCTFSYLRGDVRGETEAEVPAGALITVVATSSEMSATGYSINGATSINQGKASFRYTVTDDVEIVAGVAVGPAPAEEEAEGDDEGVYDGDEFPTTGD